MASIAAFVFMIQLVLSTSHLVNFDRDNDSPFLSPERGIVNVYSGLKNHRTGFYNKAAGNTLIFLPQISDTDLRSKADEKTCVSIALESIAVCTQANTTRFFSIPMADFHSLVTLHVHTTNFNHVSVVPTESYEYFLVAVDNHFIDRLTGAVEISWPVYGSLISGPLFIGLRQSMIVDVSMDEMNQHGSIEVSADGVFKTSLPPFSDSVYSDSKKSSEDIEPGSWFIKAVIRDNRLPSDVDVSLPDFGYIEYVLSSANISRQRRFVQRQSQDLQSCQVSLAIMYPVSLLSTADIDFYDNSYCDAENGIHASTHAKLSLSPCTSDTQVITPSSLASEPQQIHVCIWGSNRLDGQKSIWLEQMRNMNKSEFRFSWTLTLTESRERGSDDPWHARKGTVLRELLGIEGVIIYGSPYNRLQLSRDVLDDVPDDGSQTAAEASSGGEDDLYRYMASRLRAADFDLNRTSPLWVRSTVDLLVQHLIAAQCDVVVYGNNRGFSSDVLITDSARILGIPTVSELLNLFADHLIVPNVIVAPSTFAVEHSSISGVVEILAKEARDSGAMDLRRRCRQWLKAKKTSSPFSNHEMLGKLDLTNFEVFIHSCKYLYSTFVRDLVPNRVVIPPAVDRLRFQPITSNNHVSYGHPDCVPLTLQSSSFSMDVRKNSHQHQKGFNSVFSPCFSVGFIARLAPEKSPGLFVLAAHTILQSLPHARFTVIGDGDVKASLINLTERLGIPWAFSFVGWIGSEDLPSYIRGFDVVINPSLRSWSETFCISNIEVMSVGVPLVTFAVGGIGEYVDPGDGFWSNQHSSISDDTPAISVMANAVVVNHATPEALAEGTLLLAANATLRQHLGRAAQATIEGYFTADRQMAQYATLYKLLNRQRLQRRQLAMQFL